MFLNIRKGADIDMLSFYDGVNFQALKEDANADFEELTQTCDLTLQQLERIVDYKTFLPNLYDLRDLCLSFFQLLNENKNST